MSTNYIYLLQEREFIKTKENVYKVGMTTKENFSRFNQYPKGSILLFQMICNNCKNIEKQVIELFKKSKDIKHRKDIGKEYFEGCYKNMINIIYLTIKDEIVCDGNNNIIDNSDSYKMITMNDSLRKKLHKEFPDYINDESFGGNKKYIKIIEYDGSEYGENEHDGNVYTVKYINLTYINLKNGGYDINIIETFELSTQYAANPRLFKKLISKISMGEIYDINSSSFKNKINKTKFKIEIENYDDFILNYKEPEYKEYYPLSDFDIDLYNLFHSNIVINNLYYTTAKPESDWDISKNYNIKFEDLKRFDVDVGDFKNNWETICKINSKYYFEEYLKRYIPYLIRWTNENNYYMLDRRHVYIGLGAINPKDVEETIGEMYLFESGSEPWKGEYEFNKMIDTYKKTIKKKKLKECLNDNPYTRKILHSFEIST